ncbi:P-glycoprotein 21 [Actinidia rufa]|uniref:p-glycoprotein 21 n=1 Tax=Actinidia rufa TaxID=165716 RepID=A0A7J0EBR0_9ERIC|nr:P-glycoprotein 21 [Actinidia rufa]
MAPQYPETTLSTEEDVTKDDIEDIKKAIITEAFPFHKLLSYADALDWTLIALGALESVVHGLAQPIGYLLLGKALDAFGNNIHDTKAMAKALKKVIPFAWYMALATFPAGVLVLVNRNHASFEDGIRSYQIFSFTVPSITELWTLNPTVISAISVLTPAFQTLDRKTEIEPDTPKESHPEIIIGDIEFQNVHFNYPSRPEVTILNNFSLQIQAGSKVALVWPSGAGKSSLLALLLRFYEPREGRQEPLLFSCSIRDNICYGNETTSEVQVIEVSREASKHKFISTLPEGYDTMDGEKGCQLSWGQRQRITIARTLLKRPAITL